MPKPGLMRRIPMAAFLLATTMMGTAAQAQSEPSSRELWIRSLQAQKAREEAEKLNPPPPRVETRQMGVPPTGDNSPERRFPVLDVMPVGEGLPAGSATDLFGLGLGQTYDEVRKSLIARHKPVQQTDEFLARSGVSIGGANRPPLLVNEHGEAILANFDDIWRRSHTSGRAAMGQDPTELVHRGRISTRADHDGGREVITAEFSSPASGHQLVRLAFRKNFPLDAQPLVADWIDAIRTKFGLEPVRTDLYGVVFAQMDDGKPIRSSRDVYDRCRSLIEMLEDATGLDYTNLIDRTRKDRCRTAIRLQWGNGSAPTHMAQVAITFVDGMRFHRSLVTDVKALDQTKADRMRGVTAGRPRL